MTELTNSAKWNYRVTANLSGYRQVQEELGGHRGEEGGSEEEQELLLVLLV